MKRTVFNRLPSVLFHRGVLLMILGLTICLTLFVLRRRHVVKGLAQTNNDRFNMKDIRIKPFEGLKTDDIYFPSTTFSWYSSTYTYSLSSSTASTGKPTAQTLPPEYENDSVSNNLDSSLEDENSLSTGKTYINGARNKPENIDLKGLRDAALRKQSDVSSNELDGLQKKEMVAIPSIKKPDIGVVNGSKSGLNAGKSSSTAKP